MRVVILGAGKVGSNIAEYLSRESNDITVIDNDAESIERLTYDLDINGVVGHASSPDVLSKAGLNGADMLIAVTYSDETNMVACQIAHSLFNVPKKVARIRNQSYLNQAWINLFSRDHLPIDLVISPEAEVAKSIYQKILVTGASEVIPMHKKKLYLIGVFCDEKCPILNTPLAQLRTLFPDVHARIISIMRNGKSFIPTGSAQLQVNDEVYFVAEAKDVQRAMTHFGYETTNNPKTVIVGGGNVGYELCRLLEEDGRSSSVTIIERNSERAEFLSNNLGDMLVLNGDGLAPETLKEAGIANADTFIAVSNDDETNALSSLEAKQFGCKRAMALVTRSNYSNLLLSINIDAIISPQDVTVSKIMRHVRRGRIKEAYNLRNGFAEFIEAQATENCRIVNTPISEIKISKGIHVSAIIRGDEIIFPRGDDIVRPNDYVIIFALAGHAAEVEKLFCVDVDLF